MVASTHEPSLVPRSAAICEPPKEEELERGVGIRRW